MKISGKLIKWLLLGGAGLVLGGLYCDFKKGEEYEADEYVSNQLSEERTQEHKNILDDYGKAETVKKLVEEREKRAYEMEEEKAKERLHFNEKIAAAKANALKQLDEYKAAVNYDQKIAKADAELKSAINLDPELWMIESKKADLIYEKKKAKTRYETRKIGLGSDDADTEYAKLLKKEFKAKKEAIDEKLENLETQEKMIKDHYKDLRDRSVEDVEKAVKERGELLNKKTQEAIADIKAELEKETAGLKDKIIAERNVDEAEIISKFDDLKARRNEVLKQERLFKEHILDKMDKKDRIALYLKDKQFSEKGVKASILFVSGALIFVVGGGFVKAFRFAWDVAGRMSVIA